MNEIYVSVWLLKQSYSSSEVGMTYEQLITDAELMLCNGKSWIKLSTKHDIAQRYSLPRLKIKMENAVADRQQGVVLQFGIWLRGLLTPRCKLSTCYEFLQRASD
jgi:hypothetical protein